ncbi:unnamed protein product [Darwinula stevensoni]|uniref:Protein kinase domain-containing protein n=1 Tax=Darwinula stevensoni TaxID=69355 RepID=A0A7R8XHK3_9CRUS|nr:unnamed protein product [Darwinula stevensoni]CAG0892641.1 unnamed protein product [Darwinula stevensoni]
MHFPLAGSADDVTSSDRQGCHGRKGRGWTTSEVWERNRKTDEEDRMEKTGASSRPHVDLLLTSINPPSPVHHFLPSATSSYPPPPPTHHLHLSSTSFCPPPPPTHHLHLPSTSTYPPPPPVLHASQSGAWSLSIHPPAVIHLFSRLPPPLIRFSVAWKGEARRSPTEAPFASAKHACQNMETVGEYEYSTKDLIGHGAFAVVFKGRHKQRKQDEVAVKSITKKNLGKSQSLLSKEISILRELRDVHHENIVSLLDCKETGNHVHLVMEYCNGGDLADYLQIKGTLSEDTICLFLRQLGNAMKALNAKGIVHRDLKPQNILLSHRGGKKSHPKPHEITLKIADFGFARFLQDGVMAATLCGSPMYMAPEVIMSQGYDSRADLWSLGTITFQCLVGKAPFTAPSPQALRSFYEKNPNLSPKIPSGTSQALGDLLKRLLKRNPEERLDVPGLMAHPFLRLSPSQPTPIPVPSRSPSLSPSRPLVTFPASPSPPTGAGASPPLAVISEQESYEQPSSGSRGSPEEAEDFVLVDYNLTEQRMDCPSPGSRIRWSKSKGRGGSQSQSSSPGGSINQEPIPVPSMRDSSQDGYADVDSSPRRSGGRGRSFSVPSPQMSPCGTRRQAGATSPIAMRRVGSGDIASLSPPSLQFTLSTSPPPGGAYRRRRPSASSTPPSVSPSNVPAPILRKSSGAYGVGGSCPYLLGAALGDQPAKIPMPLQMDPMLSRGTLHFHEELRRSQTMDGPLFREVERGALVRRPSLSTLVASGSPSPPPAGAIEGPIAFVAPALTEDTIMEREHNETLARLQLVLALSDAILELSGSRHLSQMMSTGSSTAMEREKEFLTTKGEQLALYLKACHLLAAALHLAREELGRARLQRSPAVRQVVHDLNTRFHESVENVQGVYKACEGSLSRSDLHDCLSRISADRLLYDHAIELCQGAALDELMETGAVASIGRRYQVAQILLHYLAQTLPHPRDKSLLMNYKAAVEKRLTVLEHQGHVHAYDSS